MNTVRTLSKRLENIFKIPNRSHRAEEYNNWTEKFSRLEKLEDWITEFHNRARGFIKSEKQTEEGIKKEWIYLQEIMGHHQMDQCVLYRDIRRREER